MLPSERRRLPHFPNVLFQAESKIYFQFLGLTDVRSSPRFYNDEWQPWVYFVPEPDHQGRLANLTLEMGRQFLGSIQKSHLIVSWPNRNHRKLFLWRTYLPNYLPDEVVPPFCDVFPYFLYIDDGRDDIIPILGTLLQDCG